MINKAYKTSLLPILRSTKSLPPASLTVPRLALVMAHAKAGVESYPSRRIHVEDISSQVPELPIRIFRLKNDLKAYLDLHSHNDETHEAIERIFEGYYAYSKEKFKQILMPDTVNIYVQATMIREFPTFFYHTRTYCFFSH